MTRSVGILLLVLAGLAMLPQTALAGQFKKPVYYSAPGLPWAVVTADFNGDNNLDLAVADFGNQFVGTLLGKGNGSFRKGPSFSVSPYSPVALAVGDFDGDQIPDLAVVEYNGPADGKLGIVLGNGPVAHPSAGGWPPQAVFWLEWGSSTRWADFPLLPFSPSRGPLAFNFHCPFAARRVRAEAAPLPVFRGHGQPALLPENADKRPLKALTIFTICSYSQPFR